MSNNELIIIPKIEKYIEYMLKNILLATKIDKNKRLEIYNLVDAEIYFQRICIRIMYNN